MQRTKLNTQVVGQIIFVCLSLCAPLFLLTSRHFWRFFLDVNSDKEQRTKYIPGPIWPVKSVNVVMCLVLLQCLLITPSHQLIQSSVNSATCKGTETETMRMRKCLKPFQQASASYHESFFKYRSFRWDDKIWIFLTVVCVLRLPTVGRPEIWRLAGGRREKVTKGHGMAR